MGVLIITNKEFMYNDNIVILYFKINKILLQIFNTRYAK